MSRELPKGWVEVQLREACRGFNVLDPGKQPNAMFTYVDIGAIDNQTGSIQEPKTFLGREAPSRARRTIRAQDVLFSTVRPYLKNISLVPDELNGCLTSTGVCILRAHRGMLDPKYLYYTARSDAFVKDVSGAMDGSLYPAVRDEDVLGTPVQLPPLNEQKRIVAKIDALTEKSREAREALDEVPALLDKLRQSILAAAFRGDLTKKWREQNPDVEPASVLLERIRKERRQKWEDAELAKFKAKGKLPADEKWKAKYVEPEPVDTEGLPELPEGWCWVRMDTIALLESGQTPKGIEKQSSPDASVPFVRVGDMNRPGNESVIWSSEVRLSISGAANLGLHVRPTGTIIFPKRGGAIGTNKKRRLGLPSAYDLNTMGLVPADSVADWLWHWFQTVQLNALNDGGVIPQINHGDIAPLRLPMAPQQEQKQLTQLLDQLALGAHFAAEQVSEKTSLLSHLDSSILAKAFRGELVPQDPNDEPASVLLDRIRAEREKSESGHPKRKQTR